MYYINNQYWITYTKHLNEARNNAKICRDHYLTEEIYTNIFKSAIRNGLTSFRDKGRTIISAKTYDNKIFSIMVSLESKTIFVISVFKEGSLKHYKPFNKIQNRIYCDYIIPRANEKAVKNKIINRSLNEYSSEDNIFLNAVSDIVKINKKDKK